MALTGFERSEHAANEPNGFDREAESKDLAKSTRWRVISFMCCSAGETVQKSHEEKSVGDNNIESGLTHYSPMQRKLGGWRTMPFIFGIKPPLHLPRPRPEYAY